MSKQKRPPLRARQSYVEDFYPDWVRNTHLRATDMARLRHEARSFEYEPLISILLPVYNPERYWLERALDSVMSQIYTNWELCVCDDASTEEHVKEILSRYERLDQRIKIKFLETNTGISGASNEALSLSTGEFVGLLVS